MVSRTVLRSRRSTSGRITTVPATIPAGTRYVAIEVPISDLRTGTTLQCALELSRNGTDFRLTSRSGVLDFRAEEDISRLPPELVADLGRYVNVGCGAHVQRGDTHIRATVNIVGSALLTDITAAFHG